MVLCIYDLPHSSRLPGRTEDYVRSRAEAPSSARPCSGSVTEADLQEGLHLGSWSRSFPTISMHQHSRGLLPNRTCSLWHQVMANFITNKVWKSKSLHVHWLLSYTVLFHSNIFSMNDLIWGDIKHVGLKTQLFSWKTLTYYGSFSCLLYTFHFYVPKGDFCTWQTEDALCKIHVRQLSCHSGEIWMILFRL